jgi:dephospho-CoA kinase
LLNIAITGGIAEGKSTVLGYLKEMGYRVSSSDEVARTVFESAPVQDRLAELLGMEGPVTPPDLREHLWENNGLRRSVNALMHPLILKKLRELKADAIEVPLLLETCMQGYFRRVWVVTCGIAEQTKRLRSRFGDETDIDAILSSQLPTDVKAAFADVVVRTNRPPEDVIRFITAVARRSIG